MRISLSFAFISLLVVVAPAIQASTEGSQNPVVSGQLTIVSDYIWRGLSQTWGQPALQISVSGNSESGLYANLFTSNVASQFVPGATIEMDYTIGYQREIQSVGLDLGATYATYPGANYDKASFNPKFKSSNPNTVELYAAATWASLNIRAGYIPTKFYGWNENNSGVNGIFNSEQPNAGLSGSSKGAVNLEANYTYNISQTQSIQATLGYQHIPHSSGVDWGYARISTTWDISSGWSLCASGSATTDPDGFKDYASLTANNQQTTPSRKTITLAVSKHF